MDSINKLSTKGGRGQKSQKFANDLNGGSLRDSWVNELAKNLSYDNWSTSAWRKQLPSPGVIGWEGDGLNPIDFNVTSANALPSVKVIIDKSRGEVSLLEQDTIENVS